MTRSQLAAQIAKNLVQRGLHFQNGSTVWRTVEGHWGALPGQERPPQDTAFYTFLGWPENLIPTRVKVETILKRIEQEKTGRAAYVPRRSVDRRKVKRVKVLTKATEPATLSVSGEHPKAHSQQEHRP